VKLDLFDYALPPHLIAQAPTTPRDHSRLLYLGHDARSHHRFYELPSLLRPGDLLVVNRTKVIAARLRGEHESGAKVEMLATSPFTAIGRPARRLQPGMRIRVGPTWLTVTSRHDEEISSDCDLMALAAVHGEVPLPPYIQRPAAASDALDYQSIFAKDAGAIAAPTASLHFTEALLAALLARGVLCAEVVLHVGLGTFAPVRDPDDVQNHRMHAERYEVPAETACMLDRAKRVVAVGTTVVRALESFRATGRSHGSTELFILPGYAFLAVDALITNFHVPRSTLLMLVAAFAGRTRILDAYREAIACQYRFFSYGDGMLIEKQS
jgi:S-adenosylmethionine:tRNA ribosyltransferase-isomerase